MLLNIELSTIFWTVLNLLILYFLLKRFLFQPVNRMLEARAKSIADAIADAQGQKEQSQRLKADCEARLSQAREEAAGLVAQARERGEREYRAILDGARADAQKLLADTRAQLAAERGQMIREARQQVAALALLAASKVTQKTLDAESDRALVDAFLSEAGELQ